MIGKECFIYTPKLTPPVPGWIAMDNLDSIVKDVDMKVYLKKSELKKNKAG